MDNQINAAWGMRQKGDIMNILRKHRFACVVITWLLFSSGAGLWAETLYVDQRATEGGDGSAWHHAFTDLQDALATALHGDTILIAQGIYRPDDPNGDPNATFTLVSGVTLQGGYAGLGTDDPDQQDPNQFETILSGDLNGDDVDAGASRRRDPKDPLDPWTQREDNSFHVVTGQATDANTVLAGVTITAGYARNRFGGGGLRTYSRASLILRNCVFLGNDSDSTGGAIQNTDRSSLSLMGCSVIGNRAALLGGGIFCERRSPLLLKDCEFRDNWSSTYGGCIASRGRSHVTAERCVFRDNTASSAGGAIFSEDDSACTLINCLFTGNEGGVMLSQDGPVTLLHCTITNNVSVSRVSIVRVAGPTEIFNSIILGNNARGVGDHYDVDVQDNTFLMDNSFLGLWRHQAREGEFQFLRIPSFGEGFVLLPGSSAIDAGSNGTEYVLPETDLAGKPRIVNGRPDVGANEFQGIIYVDSNDDSSDLRCRHGSGSGTRACPFWDIQWALDVALDGHTIEVAPGIYATQEPRRERTPLFTIDKNVIVRSEDPTDPLIANQTILAGAVVFTGGQDATCMLSGFRIEDPEYGAIYGNHTGATLSHCFIVGNAPCDGAVLMEFDGLVQNCLIADNTTSGVCGVLPVVYRCNATFRNCTIANNRSGIMVHTASFENCILQDNRDRNIYLMDGGTLTISYSSVDGYFVEEGSGFYSEIFVEELGDGSVSLSNIDTGKPHFARLGAWRDGMVTVGDYHLKSQGWRWSEDLDHGLQWVFDTVTSPGVDGGNPESGLGEELATAPGDPSGEYGVNNAINMGVYGGTYQASLAPFVAPAPPPPGAGRRR